MKPANILFPRMDNEVWLADFGICHDAAAKDRLSDAGEVVGPRGFTAPELETGVMSSVSPSADLYSLGKVIYFLLSGGRRVVRENLDDPTYISTFAIGERFALLRTLLGRLITSADRRIATAKEVREALLRIQEWDKHALALSLSTSALAAIANAQRAAQRKIDVETENARVINNQNTIVQSVSDGILMWLDCKLQKIASHLTQSGTHDATVCDATWVKDEKFLVENGREGYYVGLEGKQIEIRDKSSVFPTLFVLKLYLCELRKVRFSFEAEVTPIKAVDPKMALIPFVADKDEGLGYRSGPRMPWNMGGFVQDRDAMERSKREFMQRMGTRQSFPDQAQIASSFVAFSYNVAAEFQASEWPAAIETLKKVISDAFEALIIWSTSNPRSVGK